MWTIYHTILLVVVIIGACVYFFGKYTRKLICGDPGTDDAATECAEIAWRLNLAQSQGQGDPKALEKFDHFWALVTKYSLDHEAIAVVSLKTVLNHACKAFEKAHAGNEAKKIAAESYRVSMNQLLIEYIETQELNFRSA